MNVIVLLSIFPRALQESVPHRRTFLDTGVRNTPWSSVSSLSVIFDRPCIPLLVSPTDKQDGN